MSQYEDLLKKFDGTIESVPAEIEALIIDGYAESENLQAFAGENDVPAELIRVVLEQPDLMEKALARRKGEFTLKFVNKVLPAAMNRAAEGGTGATQAAKLVADTIGAVEGRPVGRPPKTDQPESGSSLEEELRNLEQAEKATPPKKKVKVVAKSKRTTTGKTRSKLPRRGNVGTL